MVISITAGLQPHLRKVGEGGSRYAEGYSKTELTLTSGETLLISQYKGTSEYRFLQISIPKPAYQQLQKLALQTGRTVPGYVRYLIIQELQRLNLPIYVMDRSGRTD